MLSVALAGKPNAGKSTFFRAATMADVDVGNYPFTTIDPNRGVSHVRTRCPCLDREERCGDERCSDGKRYVPIELLDVAGLVPGAHEGRGLGNQFLDALTNADVILNVVDASGATDEEGEPVEVGSYDPTRDVEFVEEEMDLWIAGIVDRNWETVVRQSRSPEFDVDEALTELLTGVGATERDVARVLRGLEYPTDPQQWTDEDRETLASEIRAVTKPIVVVANKADVAPGGNVETLREAATGSESSRARRTSSGADTPDGTVVPCTAEGELALRQAAKAGLVRYNPGDESFEVVGELTDAQRSGLDRVRGVMEEYGGTGVQQALNTAAYDRLDHVTAFPVQNETKWTDGQGNVLPDAFLLPRGSTPRDLAYAVHSDIGDGYLHAVDARAGRRIAEDHELAEGDVVKIVSTAN